MIELVIGYLFTINLYAILLMYGDKKRAKKKEWRVPEKKLWTIAFIGGSFGVMVGMNAFRHKTKHMSFVVGIPLVFSIQIIITIYFLRLGLF